MQPYKMSHSVSVYTLHFLLRSHIKKRRKKQSLKKCMAGGGGGNDEFSD